MSACAYSPDGTRIVSASGDNTLKLWDAASGAELATLVLPAAGTAVSVHPFAPKVVCGDRSGGVHVADLVGVLYGPIVVTAREREKGLVVRCPACWREHPAAPDYLGSALACPSPSCCLELLINPFVLKARTPYVYPRGQGSAGGKLGGRGQAESQEEPGMAETNTFPVFVNSSSKELDAAVSNKRILVSLFLSWDS